MGDPVGQATLWARLLNDIAHEQLPTRRNRINLRVVKQAVIRFLRKRLEHFHPAPLASPFRD